MGDRVGERFGDYRLKRLISDRGAFADVYESEHVVDQTKAAVKVWKVQIEARAFLNDVHAAVLRHPHVVEVLDFGIKKDVPYLVMAYASHGSLKGQSLPLPFATIVAYVRQIAHALDYAHGRGIVHRDIKPDNILLGPRGEIWVGDFGIATPSFTRQDTLLGEPEKRLTGTPDYMAPEQWEDQASPASDQYALGVMVYEWLCGERPFRGNLVALYQKHTNEPPPLLRDKRPTVSPAIEQVVMKALEKDPEERFRSVQEFAQALEACLNPPIGTTLLTYRDHATAFTAVAWSPDGQYIATGGTTESIIDYSPNSRTYMQNAVVQVWDAVTGQLQRTYTYHRTAHWLAHAEKVWSVAWSPDGSKILFVSEGTYRYFEEDEDENDYHSFSGTHDEVQLLDVLTGDTLYSKGYTTSSDHGGETTFQALWVSGSACIVYGSTEYDAENYNARGFERVHLASLTSDLFVYPSTKSEQKYIGRHGAGNAALSPEGRYIAVSRFTGVEIVDTVLGKIISACNYKSWVKILSWSPESKQIASHDDDGTVDIWDVLRGNKRLTYTGHSKLVKSAAWSPDGKSIASGGDDHTIQVWDSMTGVTIHTYSGHTKSVEAISWSPDGTRLASASADGTVQVWQAV